MAEAARKTPTLSAKERFREATASLSGLSSVEEVIRSKLVSDAPLLQEIPEYLFSIGGKRVRPLLTLLASRALGVATPPQPVIDVAAGIELIHMATLLHDDIIDRSPVRRHHSSAFLKYGTPNTLLAGDFLLVRAFALCAHLDLHIIEATEAACVELTEGEILETSLAESAHSVDSSLVIAKKKTASLFRLATESGAHLSGGSPAVVRSFAIFGESLGIAFQVVDDILDVISSEKQLGKRPGTDIRERKPSLVNVLWLASGSTRATRLLTDAAVEISDADIDAALDEIRSSPVLEEAKRIARAHADTAVSALETAALEHAAVDPTVMKGLHALVEYCIERME